MVRSGKTKTLLTAGILMAGMLAALPVSAANLNFGSSNTPTSIVRVDSGKPRWISDTGGVPQDWDSLLMGCNIYGAIQENCEYVDYQDDGQFVPAEDVGTTAYQVKKGLVRRSVRTDVAGFGTVTSTYMYNRKNCLLKRHTRLQLEEDPSVDTIFHYNKDYTLRSITADLTYPACRKTYTMHYNALGQIDSSYGSITGASITLTYNPDGTVATCTSDSPYALSTSYHFYYENGRLTTVTDDLSENGGTYFVLNY